MQRCEPRTAHRRDDGVPEQPFQGYCCDQSTQIGIEWSSRAAGPPGRTHGYSLQGYWRALSGVRLQRALLAVLGKVGEEAQRTALRRRNVSGREPVQSGARTIQRIFTRCCPTAVRLAVASPHAARGGLCSGTRSSLAKQALAIEDGTSSALKIPHALSYTPSTSTCVCTGEGPRFACIQARSPQG